MEKIIELVTVLFLLSMICERVAEFFKNYLSCKTMFGKSLIGDTTTKFPPDSPEELRRTYRILKLNLFFGFITAALAHASLFDILRNLEKPQIVLGWPNDYKFNLSFTADRFLRALSFLIGSFLTGCFLSLGSKFWHDLLDILLAIKNVKKAVGDSQVTAFDTLADDEKFQVIAAAIKENKDDWKTTIKGYQGVSAAQKLSGADGQPVGPSIRFNVSKKEEMPLGASDRVPTAIYYKGYRIPTDVLETGMAVALGSHIDPEAMPRPLGSSIGRSNTTTSGTLGLMAKLTIDNQVLDCGISCYHVLFPDELRKKRLEIKSASDINLINSQIVFSPSEDDSNSQSNVGSVVKGKLTDFVDIGIFETTSLKVSKTVYQYGKIKGVHQLTSADENNLDVKIWGRTSNEVKGKVIAVSTNQQINYFKGSPDAFPYELKQLIQIRMGAQPGDSGSALLTDDNFLVGIMVASDGNFSYAIPASFIERNFDIQFTF